MLRAAAVAFGLIAASAQPFAAQQAPAASPEDQQQVRVIPSPVLVVDIERVYAESEFGRRIESDYQNAGLLLSSENDAFLAELEAEERNIADRRDDMTVEEFRAEAEAFDIKVQDIRAQQDELVETLEARRLAGQTAFETQLRPILGQLMIDNRGVVLLEKEAAYLFVTNIDITDQAIAAVNAALGDGASDP